MFIGSPSGSLGPAPFLHIAGDIKAGVLSSHISFPHLRSGRPYAVSGLPLGLLLENELRKRGKVRRVLRNAWLQAVVILAVGIALGTGAGMLLGAAASASGATADMVFLANVVPSSIVSFVFGLLAVTRVFIHYS